jgi:hypothetical protein
VASISLLEKQSASGLLLPEADPNCREENKVLRLSI